MPPRTTPLTLAVGTSLLACTGLGTNPAPTHPRATVVLDQGWDHSPWFASFPARPASQVSPAAIQMSTTIELGRRYKGGELVLDGLVRSASLSIDHRTVGEAMGGIGPVAIPLPGGLGGGRQALSLDISAPKGGDELLLGTQFPTARLTGPPRLTLGGNGLGLISLSLEADGLHASVHASQGAQVRLLTTLDGVVIQSLGTTRVVDGIASFGPMAWQGPRWPSDDSLFFAWAILEDDAGAELDRKGVRTGLRHVALGERDMEVDGRATRMLAIRLWNRTLESTIEVGLKVGANTLELHGLPAPPSWMDRADELGMYVVDMPRCDGQVQANKRKVSDWAAELAEQDLALINHMATHPSLVLWSSEGDQGVFAPMLERYAADPVSRLTADWDVPSRPVTVSEPVKSADQPWWNMEVNQGRSLTRATADETLATVAATFRAGAIGTHMPGYSLDGADPREVEQKWRALGREHGVIPLPGERRGPARIAVSGLSPGQVVWASADWLPTTGGVANANGIARLDIWHRGDVLLDVSGVTRTVTVTPGRWVVPEAATLGSKGDVLQQAWKGGVTRIEWKGTPG